MSMQVSYILRGCELARLRYCISLFRLLRVHDRFFNKSGTIIHSVLQMTDSDVHYMMKICFMDVVDA